MAVLPIRRKYQTRFLRLVLLVLAFLVFSKISCGVSRFTDSIIPFILFSDGRPSKETQQNLRLNEQQCRATYPGLAKEVDESVKRLGKGGKFELEKLSDNYQGMVQGRIKDGKLYIISAERKPNRDMLSERQAVLHSLHRALLTSPNPLPDTVFAFSIIDSPIPNVWSFSRSNDPSIMSIENYWLMPHFSFWSWPKPFIGTIDQAISKIDFIERSTDWSEKIEKAIWRGTSWFNGAGNTQLRPKLLEATRDRGWADVQDLKWVMNGVNAENALKIEDFCRYKYIIYTEGVTYSGRLPFHQSCKSVIITPPPAYLMHTTHLMRPTFSYTLPFSPSYNAGSPPPHTNSRWPKTYSPSEANIIFVEPDWSDLEQTINWLKLHDDVAEGIAGRQRDLYVDRGFMSEGAETCYWRALIKAWAGAAIEKNGTTGKDGDEKIWGEGIRWETFSLMGETRWDRMQ